MSHSPITSLIFAQLSSWERLGDGLHRGTGRMDVVDFWPLALLAVIVGIAITLFVKVRKRNDMSEHCDDPGKLFRELSLAHSLDRASQKLLWQLAETLQLTQPAEVFVRPTIYLADLPQALRDNETDYQNLHQQLFD